MIDVIRVLLVDDDELVRAGLRVILGVEPDIDVVGEAGDGAEVPGLVRSLTPDVVLMDVRMPAVDGISATRHLVRTFAEPPRVLVLTTFGNDGHVYDALQAGATGFLLKRARPAEITQAVRTVAAGDSLLAPQLTQRIIESYLAGRRAASLPASYARLTEREREVLRCLATGLSNAEIGRELFISEATVKTHLVRVFGKLGVDDRTAAVTKAMAQGLL